MLSNKISRIEILVLSLVAILFAAGLLFSYIDMPLFESYIQEDGIVEWLTVLGLLLASITCFYRAGTIGKYRSPFFILGNILLGIVLFFGAGEEISWGQRIFDIQSPEYFQQNNSQGETNIHNLVIGGMRVNRWIFSILLTIILASYIIIMPLLYRTKVWMQRFITYFGIPLPKTYQVIAFIAFFLSSELIPHGKRAEVLELATAFMLFLIVRFPSNHATFNQQEPLVHSRY